MNVEPRGKEKIFSRDMSRDEVRMLYEAAVEVAQLVIWEYDIPQHRVIMADNEFTCHDYLKFDLPKIVDNVPQALIPHIDEASVETFLEMYHRVEAGAPAADWRANKSICCAARRLRRSPLTDAVVFRAMGLSLILVVRDSGCARNRGFR